MIPSVLVFCCWYAIGNNEDSGFKRLTEVLPILSWYKYFRGARTQRGYRHKEEYEARGVSLMIC